MPEIDVVESSPSVVLAYALDVTIQQNVDEDTSPTSRSQQAMKVIPVDQIDRVNRKSQKRKHPDITVDKHFMEYGAGPSFINFSK